MMPGRTRRVRLIAVVVCIVTVFFLYTHNEARVEQYADYVRSKSAIGGGSVLRPEAQEQKQEPLQDAKPVLPEAGVPPEAKPTTKSLGAQETPSTSVDDARETPTATATPTPTPTPTPTLASTSTADQRATKPKTTLPYIPAFDDPDELPIEVGPGPGLDDDDDDYYLFATTTAPPIHWTKLPEKFPITSTIQLPTGTPSAIPKIQKQYKGEADLQRLAAVKEAAKWAWKGFRENGWDYDEVKPISGVGRNSFNGWGATLVDSLDTLWIMGMKDEFEEAVNKTSQIDFTTSSRNDIPMFEVTIRYLGGLLGAYDVSGKKYKILLDKAVELAEILYSAFDTPNRMPETFYYWKPTFASNAHRASTRVVMAELGTMSLEFTRLAQLTLEPKYYDAIARITDAFEKWQNNTRVPGMWPTLLDASGCEKPIYHASEYKHQIPMPKGDSSLVSSEPVKVEPKVLAAAEESLKKSKGKYSGQGASNGVANPNAFTGGSLRHSPDDGLTGTDVGGGTPKKATNELNAKEPLRPDNTVAVDNGIDEAVGYGNGPHEALPPKGGSGDGHGLAKRQLGLDLEGDRPPARHRPLSKTRFAPGPNQRPTKTSSIYGDVADDVKTKEPEEDICIPQGFASSSKNGGESFTLGGQSDSTYEYLPKEWLLLGGLNDQYKSMYLASMEPIIKKLLFRPMTKDNLDILVSGEVKTMMNYTTEEWEFEHIPKGEHLTCFAGGMIAMGGKIYDIPEHVEIGRKLTDGCIWSYNVTGSGIMPESFHLASCDSVKNCKWNQTQYEMLLDPYAGFREEQREQFKEQYGIEDLPAYEKQLAAASSASAAALAAEKTATRAPSPAELNDLEDDHIFGEFGGAEKLRKRQSVDDHGPLRPPPGPQPQPTSKATTASAATLTDFTAAAKADNIWADHKPYGATPTIDDDDDDTDLGWTAPYHPIYTPPPPVTHEEYVRNKIEIERIPPGFVRIDAKGYILRPEAIESVFYMWRITGEQQWRDMGWNMFTAIEKATHAPYGHSRIDDVTKKKPEQTDNMESFWLAETLKYFYLLFDEPDRWSLDDWVLNTEAHFFRRPQA